MNEPEAEKKSRRDPKNPSKSDRRERNSNRIELNAPWDIRGTPCIQRDDPQSIINYDDETARAFIEQRTRLHAIFIQEEARTKRMGLLTSAVLALGGGVILIFAPEGKQILANWVGAALFIAAGGAAGYKRLWFKSKNNTLEARRDD
jgi:hypothetical protein